MGCGSTKDASMKPFENNKQNQRVLQNRLDIAEKQHEKHTTIDDFKGIMENVPLEKLFELGYRIVFDEYYSQETSIKDLLAIRYHCTKYSRICIAGINSEYSDEILQLACFDNGLQALQISNSNKKAKQTESGNFIYCMDQYSFGFSPNEDIELDCADQLDNTNSHRLSWLLNGIGGGRLGGNWCALTNLNKYRKVILLYG